MTGPSARDAEFTEYVSAKALWLRKVAYLLCGDWHRADDLVQATITRLYVNWHRVRAADNIDGYVRTVLVNVYLAERRSPWGRRVALFDGGEEVPGTVSRSDDDLDSVLDLRTALAALPPRSPAPPMRLDIARARESGRRRLWRRRIGRLLGVLVACGTLVGGWTVVSGGGAERVTVATVSEGTDPLVAYASFGWLPDTVAGVSYVVGAHGDQVMARGLGDFGISLNLGMYAPGDEPPVENGRTALPAQPVNGHRAYWITKYPADPVNGGDAYLRWQVPDGRWAELHAYYMPEADPRPTMLRIAADVTVGTRPVPLPLHLSGVPADFEITEVHFWRPAFRGDVAWELMIFYVAADGGRVTLVVNPEVSRTVPSRGSCMAEAGLELCVTVEEQMPESLAAIGGPEALLRRATLLGMDEREWTTQVIGRQE